MRIAMIGTRGVPARYGGFETAIEEVGQRLAAAGHEVIVYCRNGNDTDGTRPTEYLGMKLVHLPAMKKKSLETLSHTALTVARVVAKDNPDVALVFNAANAPLLPLLRARRIPVATHVDGLEWKRAKWGKGGQTYYRTAESLAVRWSDALIADAQGIADYYTEEFGVDTRLITYGAPVVQRAGGNPVASMDLEPDGYHLVVARMEPENHVHLIVEGYVKSASTKPLVVVGSAPYGNEYIESVTKLASGDERVRMVGGVWDQDLLDQLYANAYLYWHGHSVGGTNPSLLRAIGAGAATDAFDVSFNREVVRGSGRFFTTADDVAALIEADEADPATVATRREQAREAAVRYDWQAVSDAYEALCVDLAAGRRTHVKSSGRRLKPAQEARAHAEVAAGVAGAGGGVADAAADAAGAPTVAAGAETVAAANPTAPDAGTAGATTDLHEVRP